VGGRGQKGGGWKNDESQVRTKEADSDTKNGEGQGARKRSVRDNAEQRQKWA